MKKNQIHLSLTAVTFFFGLLLAIQYTNMQNPVVVDARNIDQLREELKKQEELQVNLLNEIQKNEKQLESFEASLSDEYESVLQENIEDLREEIGLTEVSGKGLVITIHPINFGYTPDGFTPYLSVELMSRFLNELKSLGAQEISVGNERIIATSAVREVNGRMMLNHTPIASFPIQIKVIATDPQRMKSGLDISYIQDDFALENLGIKISNVNQTVTVPPYSKSLHFKEIESNEE